MAHSTTCFSLMLTENGLHGQEHHTVEINREVTDAGHMYNEQGKMDSMFRIPSFAIGN